MEFQGDRGVRVDRVATCAVRSTARAGLEAPAGRTGGRSRPCAPASLLRAAPRREPRFRDGVTTCAVRSTARAGLETGVPSRRCNPSSAEVRVPSRTAGRPLRNSTHDAEPAGFTAPSGPRVRHIGDRAKNNSGSELCSLPAGSGESVKGGYPLSQKETTNRNSPKRAPAREGVSVCGAKRRAVPRWGPSKTALMTPNSLDSWPHRGTARRARRGILPDSAPGPLSRGGCGFFHIRVISGAES